MEKLFSEFDPVSKKEWLEKVEKDLKGKPLDSLNWKFNDQISLTPFSHSDDIEKPPFPIPSRNSINEWEIGEKILVSDYTQSNKEAMEALQFGVQSLYFILKDCPTKTELNTLLNNIQLDIISINFYLKSSSGKKLITDFIELCQIGNYDLQELTGSFIIKENFNLQLFDNQLVNQYQKLLSQFTFFSISSDLSNESKYSPISEITNILNLGNDLLIRLYGQSIDFNSIKLTISLGENYFLNIAKIRALKLLWFHITSEWKISPDRIFNFEAQLAPQSQTDNPNTNMIKATSQAMSAVIGGIDRLYILPSDNFKSENGTSFSRRIARNIQHLCKMESHLNNVVDPGAGSYHIENLTKNIAELAWGEFQNR